MSGGPGTSNVMRLAWILVATVALSGCGPEPAPEPSCPNSAAFSVVLVAESGPVPRQTTLTVTYGGGEEAYPVMSPPVRNDVLFCRAHERDDAEGGIALVECEVWTQSTTSLRVEASGYPLLEEQLQVDRDAHDCLRTRDVALTLRNAAPSQG